MVVSWRACPAISASTTVNASLIWSIRRTCRSMAARSSAGSIWSREPFAPADPDEIAVRTRRDEMSVED